MFSTESRSQVGVGTLVVYITLIFLTAAASGVLISTAASLQAQAHQTGTAQPTGDITATDAAGHVEPLATDYDPDRDTVLETDPFVTEIRLNVTGTPGDERIDLRHAMVVYHAGEETRFLVHESRADAADIDANRYEGQGESAFLLEPANDAATGDAVITDSEEVYQLVVPLGVAYDIDASASPSLRVAAKDWGGSPVAPASLDASALFAATDADDPAATPYGLGDVTAPPLDGTPVDQVAFDNTYLNPLPAGERVQIDIVTQNGSQDTIVAGPADIDRATGDTLDL